MLFLLSVQLDLCSPQNLEYYTSKFPQLFKQYMWWAQRGSFFENNPTSPFSSQIYLSQSKLKILLVGTSQQYLDEMIFNINSDTMDYLELKQLLVATNITISDYFQKLEEVNGNEYDLIVLPLVNCNTQLKYKDQPEVLYDRTNKFYQANNWTQIQIERIQSFEQIQALMDGYLKFNKQILAPPTTYLDFTLQTISGNTPLLLTSIIDTTQSLQFNSITFCHVSPQGQIQSSTRNCQLAIPVGMQTFGIHGHGNIGNGFEFMVKFLTQIDEQEIDRVYLFAVIKESILINKANLKQQYKAPYGYTNFINIQKIMKLNQVATTVITQDVIMRQNVKNGNILNIGQFRVLQIQFTLRGHTDTFEPLYQNNYKISLKNNGDEMAPFEGIYIYICQKIVNTYIPNLIGRINQKHGLFQFIIQSSQYLNNQFSNNILIWYSYSNDITTVSKEIETGQMIESTLTTFLQIIGNQIPIFLETLSDLRYAHQCINYYFHSNATIVYFVCSLQGDVVKIQLEYTQIEQDFIQLQVQYGQDCNLYFCTQPYNKLSNLNKYCAKTINFSVKNRSNYQYQIFFGILGIFWILSQFLLLQIILIKYR